MTDLTWASTRLKYAVRSVLDAPDQPLPLVALEHIVSRTGRLVVDLEWLDALDPTWDLINMDDDDWTRLDCEGHLRRALSAILKPGKRRGPASVTKILYLKRPWLFRIVDDIVIQQLGAGRRELLDVVLHVRAQGRANLGALRRVVDAIKAAGHSRSYVRALDTLVWASHPGTSAFTQARNVGARHAPEP